MTGLFEGRTFERNGHRFEPVMGGYHVKDLPEGRCIDVMKMMYNWRIVLAYRAPGSWARMDAVMDTESETEEVADHDKDIWYEHGYCYFGHGEGRSMYSAMLAAMDAAVAWDGEGDPEGFDKKAY